MDKEQISTIFLERLRKAQKESGISQRKLATLLGVQPNTVNSWLTGKNFPGFDTVEELAEILEVSSNWLFGGQEADLNKVKVKLIEEISKSDNEGLIRALGIVRSEITDFDHFIDHLEKLYFPAQKKRASSKSKKKKA